MTGGRKSLVPLLVLGCGLIAQANGQAVESRPHIHGSTPPAQGGVVVIDSARATVPDAEVYDHTGGRVRLYSDLIKGRVVLISFFFTDCTNICHMQGHDFAELQAQLGERVGRDVSLISISMNPAADTPQKLKHWARIFGVKPGWTLVSGDGPEMRRMIEDFTGNKPGAREVHFATVFIGDDRTGRWVAADGLAGPKELIKVIDDIRARKAIAETKSPRRRLP
jgi:protein SCO1/2